MSAVQDFPIGDVLSVTTGLMLSPAGLKGVKRLLDHMTGERVETHQIPHLFAEAAPALLRQHPQLAAVDAAGVNPETLDARLEGWALAFGEALPVVPMTSDEHEHRDAASELVEMTPAGRVVRLTGDFTADIASVEHALGGPDPVSGLSDEELRLVVTQGRKLGVQYAGPITGEQLAAALSPRP